MAAIFITSFLRFVCLWLIDKFGLIAKLYDEAELIESEKFDKMCDLWLICAISLKASFAWRCYSDTWDLP